MSLEAFQRRCETDWRIDRRAGDAVYDVLRAAGYQGTIDDLWVSVYGMIKTSVATAGEKTGHLFRPNPVPITGQTKKPGSHRS
jgi:hypothetical protein